MRRLAARRRARRLRHSWLAAALGAVSVSTPAVAQISRFPVETPVPVPVEDLSVLDRPHPDYEPLGLPWGSFYVFPSAELSATYDSNIYVTPNDTKDDVYFGIRPEVYAVSNWPRHAVSFDAQADEQVYATHSTENVTNFSTALTGRLDITQDYVTGGIAYELNHEDRASPDNVFNQKNPIQYQLGTAFLRYVHEIGIIGFRITGRIAAYGYDNGVTIDGVTVPETYRDRVEYRINPRLSYELYPGYYAFLQAPVNWRVYNAKYDLYGFQRSSHGFEVDAGVSVALTGITFARAFVGYIDQEYDDARLKPARGVGFGGDLLWNVTPITSVKLYVARTVEETVPTTVPNVIVPASSILQTAVSGAVEHALRDNVLLWARAGYIDQQFEGTPRDDSIYWGQTGVRYLINRFLNVGLDLDYHNRSSNYSIYNYSREQVTARVRVQE